MRRRGRNKSTLDKFLDLFADFSVEDQAGALKFAEVIHRQAKRGRIIAMPAPADNAEETAEMFEDGGAA